MCANQGTPYPCSQADLDSLIQFSGPNEKPVVDIITACKEIIRWNEHRALRLAARAAAERIHAATTSPSDKWRPDLMIKIFLDLDIVFFEGWLRGNVIVRWKISSNGRRHWGITHYPQERPGQCAIALSANTMFDAPLEESTSGKQMCTRFRSQDFLIWFTGGLRAQLREHFLPSVLLEFILSLLRYL